MGKSELLVAIAGLAIVKYARGGTSQSADWKAGGDATTAGDGPEYVTFQQTVSAGLSSLVGTYPGAEITLAGLVWMQGESDAVSASATYKADLLAFLADVRATYVANLPVVIGRLSGRQTSIAEPGLSAVRDAQTEVAAADPWTGLIDTDAFPLKTDNLHFDAAGQQTMGSGFARQTAYLLWMARAFTQAQAAAGLGEEAADADGDGMANAAEFVAGTDPTDAASRLAATLTPTGPDTFDLRYPAVAGRRYGIETNGAPGSAGWSPALPAETSAGPAVRALTNRADTAVFRLRAEWP